MSGPVAGAEGAAELARALELGDVDHRRRRRHELRHLPDHSTAGRRCMYEGKVVGLPVQTPWVDVRSIGAGGGSIAYVDVGGLLRVGPRSAGADPGPACYGRGGTEPTVTDAAVVLGMLGPGELAGGDHARRRARPRRALAPLAGALGFDVDGRRAAASCTIAAANMANAIREVTVEQGLDPRARGADRRSAAPGRCSATLLARELEIDARSSSRRYAGNFSAWGLLGADLTQTAARTRIMRPRRRRARRRRTTSSPSCSPSSSRAPRAGARRASARSGSTCATSARSTR